MENFIKIEKKFIVDEEIIDENDILINKYVPNKLEDFKINHNLASKLNNILLNNDIMNLFLFGPEGNGKYTLAKFYLKSYFKEKCKLEKKIFKYETKEFKYFKSRIHYEIICNDYNFNDLNLVISFFDLIINKDIETFGNKKNIIVIKNVHLLKNNILKSIKNCVDKYYLFNIFILISDKLLINKITTYFCCIRVPLPNKEELLELCNNICGSESLKIKKSETEEIVKKSNGSMKNMKHLIEFSFLSGKYEKYEDPVDDKMKFLYKIMKKKSMTTIYIVRELLKELIIENVRPNLILKFLLNKYKKEYISQKISYEKILHIIQILNKCSLRIATGLRPIINLESCMIEIIDFL